MESDRYTVLSETARIVGSSTADPPSGTKEILRLLARLLQLDELTLWLLDPRRKSFSRKISSAGNELFLPTSRKVAGTPEGLALKQLAPESIGGELRFPLGFNGRPAGILTLNPAPPLLSDEIQDLLRTVGGQLIGLSHSALVIERERRRTFQLTLLSELAEVLNGARTLREVLQAASRAIHRHSGVACTILRPLHGGTVIGRCQVRIRGPWRQLRSLFLALEEDHGPAALADRAPLFRHGLGSNAIPSPPPAMVAVPLFFQNRPMGTLTLFGGTPEDLLPLAPDAVTRRFITALAAHLAHALERVTALERLEDLSTENTRKLRETTLLYRIASAMHSTLRLNELMHLILSAATVSDGGGFERAMLFMINERSGTLQGMLCVTRDTASLVLPAVEGALAWGRPVVSAEAQEGQRRHPCCRQVMQQRLSLEEDNALSRAARKGQVVFVPRPETEPRSGAALAQALKLAPYACAPLFGRNRPLGVLVVDNPNGREEINPDRLRFLELFANLAGAAMQNSMLLHRLETAHQDLRETQERLIQGEKMAVLGEMAASVTHELRNPLVSIGGFAHRLLKVAGEGRQKEYAQIIVREVRRMEEMLSNILEFGKKQMLCFGECHLPRVIEEALALEVDALTHGAIRLVIEIADSLPAVQGDEQKLRQVLINLLSNARQAMPTGGMLTVRAHHGALRGDEAVTVEVEDTGGGIPADILRNIFNPFFTTKEKGTGLGLSISHRIIEQHRGEIEVKNREKGAVFILHLPVRAAAPFH